MGVRWDSPIDQDPQRRAEVRLMLALGLLLGSLMLAGLYWFSSWYGYEPARYEKPPSQECQEDEPCWDCKTMGNLVCGSQVP